MSVAVIIPNRKLDKLKINLQSQLPNEEIQFWPNIDNPAAVTFVIAWDLPANSLDQLINLKAIASFGAGVDNILNYKNLPNVPISRIVDKQLGHDMARYVLAQILSFSHNLKQYSQNQQRALWKPQRVQSNNKVLILGAGKLGLATAQMLIKNEFDVTTWSRTLHVGSQIKQCSGVDALYNEIAVSDVIVNILPLTENTSGILNAQLWAYCQKKPLFINVGRGEHVIEQDLLKALEKKQLSHAVLDVFSVEPLPSEHPFWQHKNISMTPHVCAVTNIDTVTKQLVTNYKRVKDNRDMNHCIDLVKGY